MAKDWNAVASAIQARLDELDMTQAELASRAGVAQETVRELRTNLRPRRRSSRTLSAVSEALNWPPGHVTALLNGDQAVAGEDAQPEQLAAIANELAEVAARLNDIAERLAKIQS